MQIRAWSNEFISGIPEIDSQHKDLFELINRFALENDEDVTEKVLLSFLDRLWEYCIYHFTLEEKMMRDNDYPLLDYHVGLHQSLRWVVTDIKSEIMGGTLKEPYTTVVRMSTDWLNEHIAKHDLSFFSYCKNKDFDLNKSMLGKVCEISTLSNEMLGVGRIESVDNNRIDISHSTGKILALELNDIVKISSAGKGSFQAFLAMIFHTAPDLLKLFNATVLKTANDREFFRVKADMEASLWVESELRPATIVDISAVGMMLATDEPLDISQLVKVEFVAQNTHFVEFCKVIRAVRRVEAPDNYGLAFESMTNTQSDKLISFLFKEQAMNRHGIKK